MVRQDQRKVAKLWVINVLSNPRPTLETYPYVMPGEANAPQPKLEVFDIGAKSRTAMKADVWKDQNLGVEFDLRLARGRTIRRAVVAGGAWPSNNPIGAPEPD